MPDTLISQSAIAYLQTEYKAVGVDLETMQRNYILVAGAKMLALALLSMAVAVCVTFLAARIAASVSKNCAARYFIRSFLFPMRNLTIFLRPH